MNCNTIKPTRKEYETKSKEGYTLYKIETSDKKKCMHVFWAKTRDEAIDVLNDFRKDNPDGEYVYSTCLVALSTDGEIDYFDDINSENDGNLYEYTEDDRSSVVEYIKDTVDSILLDKNTELIKSSEKCADELKKKISDFLEGIEFVKSAVKDGFDKISLKELEIMEKKIYSISDNMHNLMEEEYLIRTKHGYYEKWNLDNSIIEILAFNLPELIENHHGFPSEFFEIAKKMHPITGSDEDQKRSRRVCSDLASKMWEDVLEQLLDMVMKYKFLVNTGFTEDETESKYWSEHGFVVPKMQDSNDIDYKKLEDETNFTWNEIWKMFSKYGREMWD